MNTYTIYWFPYQQPWIAQNLSFLSIDQATWQNNSNYALVQDLNQNQFEQCQQACQSNQIAGIKPGANPGGSPTGCA